MGLDDLSQSGRPIYWPQVRALLQERGFNPEQVAEVEVRRSYYGRMELGYVKLKRSPLARSGELTNRGPSGGPA